MRSTTSGSRARAAVLRGFDGAFARRLPTALLAHGFIDVEAEVTRRAVTGGSSMAQFDSLGLAQLASSSASVRRVRGHAGGSPRC